MFNTIQFKEKYIRNMIPGYRKEDFEIAANLPKEFKLDIPLIIQEDKHLCGSACVQMINQFFNLPFKSQLQIANEAGWSDWNSFNHSTFKEKMIIYFMNNGILPSNYYPQAFIAPALNSGIEATKLIRENPDVIDDISFEFFKTYLVKTQKPLIIRIHFDQTFYNMTENMINKIDNSGHCMLLTGFDENGFYFNDPWDKNWGGDAGGKDYYLPGITIVSYPCVNYSRSFALLPTELFACFEPIQDSVTQNKELELNSIIEWPGIKNITLDKPYITNFSLTLECGGDIEIIGSNNQNLNVNFVAGDILIVKWRIRTGMQLDSHSIKLQIDATMVYPAVPWENLPANSSILHIQSENRICVFEESYLQNAGLY